MINVFDIIKNMDKKQLSQAVKQAKEFANTEQGKEIINKLKNNSDINSLGINADEKDKILKEIKKNPDIAKKISEILNEKG